MPQHDSCNNAERQLLAALCSASTADQIRIRIVETLVAHQFASPEHEIIFEALKTIPSGSAIHIRKTLAARVTRLGFPDIDVKTILQMEPPSAEEVRLLLRQLET
jgi:hypothetical protein